MQFKLGQSLTDLDELVSDEGGASKSNEAGDGGGRSALDMQVRMTLAFEDRRETQRRKR